MQKIQNFWYLLGDFQFLLMIQNISNRMQGVFIILDINSLAFKRLIFQLTVIFGNMRVKGPFDINQKLDLIFELIVPLFRFLFLDQSALINLCVSILHFNIFVNSDFLFEIIKGCGNYAQVVLLVWTSESQYLLLLDA